MKRISFKTQILLTAFILTLFSTAFPTFITSKIFINDIEEENTNQSIENFRQTEKHILTLLSDIHDEACTMWSNEYISDYLLENYITTSEETKSRFLFVQEIKKVVKSTSDTAAVLFIDTDGKMAGSSYNTRYFNNDSNYAFYQRLKDLDLNYNALWLGMVYNHELLPSGKQENSTTDDSMICGVKKHTYTLSGSTDLHTLYIVFAVNKSSLLNCFSYLEYEGSSVFLLDENGRTLSGSHPIGEVPEFYDKFDSHTADSFIFQDADNHESQIIYYKINSIGWTLVKSIPKDIYAEKVSSMWRVAILIEAITFVLIYICYSVWARNFCIPITKLTNSLMELKNGNFDTKVPIMDNYSNEVYLVCDQFNELIDNLNELLLQKELSEREHAALEIKTLQAQITPHFIYNTLTSIRYMAFAAGASNVEEALIAFSNIIRPVFSSWQQDWRLQDELAFIENYIHLMRMRFQNHFHIEIDVDEKATICRIPRFALQTLLENCCEHGFEGDQTLNICLKALIKDNILYIHVIDDGVGISKEKLSEIQENLCSDTCGSSIGLANLNKRIKLFCGNDCGLKILSTYNQGTEIIARIRVIT